MDKHSVSVAAFLIMMIAGAIIFGGVGYFIGVNQAQVPTGPTTSALQSNVTTSPAATATATATPATP